LAFHVNVAASAVPEQTIKTAAMALNQFMSILLLQSSPTGQRTVSQKAVLTGRSLCRNVGELVIREEIAEGSR
jgi:hypothetical protein